MQDLRSSSRSLLEQSSYLYRWQDSIQIESPSNAAAAEKVSSVLCVDERNATTTNMTQAEWTVVCCDTGFEANEDFFILGPSCDINCGLRLIDALDPLGHVSDTLKASL